MARGDRPGDEGGVSMAPAPSGRYRTREAKRFKIQLVDEHVDHSNRAVLAHVIVNAVREQ
jgi:hypothetical protein